MSFLLNKNLDAPLVRVESSLFGLPKWLAPARIGLFQAWAWIWL